ncbi:CPBP family intramembrane glutamic endopeptidase [Streptomyces sp. CFMR 7]|uniref:CPBP family intramembrane glutamic endopeptidase n=1 Tax=Streptomyces sp. CFMR 7 TaxID=1649184 RepID=UPI0021B54211|nr:CPBP family intramembrane glutamic endopeptidase [Streptomyces sp. CFMR 7]
MKPDIPPSPWDPPASSPSPSSPPSWPPAPPGGPGPAWHQGVGPAQPQGWPQPPGNGWPQGWQGHPGWQGPPGAVPPAGPVRAEAGSRYDQQGRNGQGGRFGWLGELSLVVLLLFVGIVVVTGFAAVLAAVLDAGPDSPDSEVFFEDPVADMAFQLVGIAIGIPVVLWGARYLGRRPAGTVSSVLGRLRWKWLGLCAAVAVPMIIVQFGIMIAWTWGEESAEPAGDGFPGWTAFLVSLAVLGALVPFQAAAEEYVFRGWLVQVIGRAVRSPWPAVVIASLLFALAHGFGELSGFILLFYSALWWGWLVIRTGGLEAVITMHAANNLLAFGLAAGFGELASTETAADAPWQAMAVEFVFAPLYCLVMARIADRKGVARVSPGEGPRAGAGTELAAGAGPAAAAAVGPGLAASHASTPGPVSGPAAAPAYGPEPVPAPEPVPGPEPAPESRPTSGPVSAPESGPEPAPGSRVDP